MKSDNKYGGYDKLHNVAAQLNNATKTIIDIMKNNDNNIVDSIRSSSTETIPDSDSNNYTIDEIIQEYKNMKKIDKTNNKNSQEKNIGITNDNMIKKEIDSNMLDKETNSMIDKEIDSNMIDKETDNIYQPQACIIM